MICKGKEKSVTGLSTLCYIEKDGKYLMLHRTVKENDINARYGIFGMDKAASTYIPRKANTIYSIYVRRKDYNTALLLLHSSINN